MGHTVVRTRDDAMRTLLTEWDDEADEPGRTLVLGGRSPLTLREWIDGGGRQFLEHGGRIVVFADGVAEDACSALAGIRRPCDHAYLRDCAGRG